MLKSGWSVLGLPGVVDGKHLLWYEHQLGEGAVFHVHLQGDFATDTDLRERTEAVFEGLESVANLEFIFHDSPAPDPSVSLMEGHYSIVVQENTTNDRIFAKPITASMGDGAFIATAIIEVPISVSDETSEILFQNLFTHEILHTLGLAHPGNYNDGAKPPVELVFSNDNAFNSIMTYVRSVDNHEFRTLGPGLVDTYALQELYGAPKPVDGDQVIDVGYDLMKTLTSANSTQTIDFIEAHTITSAHTGVLTLDRALAAEDEILDLRPNDPDKTTLHVSTINGSPIPNLAIGAGVEIQVVEAGSGDDRIYGNALNNSIFGNDGNDFISGGDGNDNLRGGAGEDKIRGGDGDDHIIGGDDMDIMFGNDGNDTLVFGFGDHARGGDGDDTFRFNAATFIADSLSALADQTTLIVGGSDEDQVGDTLVFTDQTASDLQTIDFKLTSAHSGTIVLTDVDGGTAQLDFHGIDSFTIPDALKGLVSIDSNALSGTAQLPDGLKQIHETENEANQKLSEVYTHNYDGSEHRLAATDDETVFTINGTPVDSWYQTLNEVGFDDDGQPIPLEISINENSFEDAGLSYHTHRMDGDGNIILQMHSETIPSLYEGETNPDDYVIKKITFNTSGTVDVEVYLYPVTPDGSFYAGHEILRTAPDDAKVTPGNLIGFEDMWAELANNNDAYRFDNGWLVKIPDTDDVSDRYGDHVGDLYINTDNGWWKIEDYFRHDDLLTPRDLPDLGPGN